MKKGILYILICVSISVALFLAISNRASAAETVQYIDADGSEKSASATKVMNSNDAVTWSEGWYYVEGNVTINNMVTVSGNVNLILTDGSSLSVTIIHGQICAIQVADENSLTIYGQSDGTGSLTATSTDFGAAIGTTWTGSEAPPPCGRITINGGNIIATGSFGSAAIGGGFTGNGGVVTINGGTVKAIGGDESASGIGGGRGGHGGTVTINGGTVEAYGSNNNADIGGGAGKLIGNITINGGTVIAYGGSDSAGIGGGFGSDGGTITINGGSIIATGGVRPIGGGWNAKVNVTPKNASGDNVYLTRVKLSGVATKTVVDSLTTSCDYNITDIHTDENGILYLYLPVDTTVTAASASSRSYSGSIKTLSNGSAYGVLYTTLVSEVTVPEAGTYSSGQALDFTVRFTNSVTVTTDAGIPYIPLIVDSTAREAAYVSGSGSTELLFRYTVLPGENDLDGISIGSSIELNGGAVIDGDGNAAGIALTGAGSTTGILVDTPPLVTISSGVPDITNQKPISVTITFNEIVTGFEDGDITVGNGTVENFSGSGADYTADIIPSADGFVTVDIAAGAAQDAGGNFNTEAPQLLFKYDGTAPSVYSITPVEGSVDVQVSGNVIISFSEEMDISSGTITLTPSAGSAITLTGGTWSGGNTVLTVSYSGLDYDTDYVLSITGFEDMANNIMPEYSYGFTTELEPLVPTVSPNSLTIGSGATSDISVNFGQGTAAATRGEFIVMLMRAFGINPDDDMPFNFSDAGSTYYTGYLAAAKRLGLADGVGNNRFAPQRDITRQEMFVLLYKILKNINRIPQGSSSNGIYDFSDTGQIESWAIDAVESLIEAGIIEGSAGKLYPANRATRADMAQVLYKLKYLM